MSWLVVALACASPHAEPEANAPASAPSARVELVTAEVLGQRLSGPTALPRVVNFWASWCGPCKAELPHLRAFAESHKGQVEVVMVSLDLAKLKPQVEKSLQAAGLGHVTHWQLDDPDPVMVLPTVIETWPNQVPVTLVVSPEGEVVKQFNVALDAADLAGLDVKTPGWWNR